MTIIWCMVSELSSATERILCYFGLFFALLSHNNPKKSKFWESEKNAWRYYYFTQVHHRWQLYVVWFLRYEAWQNFLSSWTVFCPLTPLTTPKIKILKTWKKKEKKHLEISSFYTSVPKNHEHILYCSWDMACDRCNYYFSFWAIFCPFTPPPPTNNPKNQNFEKMKNMPGYHHFTICVQKIMIRSYTVPEIWCMTDRWTDGWKKWHRGGCPT